MKNDNPKPAKNRMVHVRLTDETHKRLRIRAAEMEMTLQDWAAMAIENELDRHDKKRKVK
jgi:predicted HicB family RNase H-like nuclease